MKVTPPAAFKARKGPVTTVQEPRWYPVPLWYRKSRLRQGPHSETSTPQQVAKPTELSRSIFNHIRTEINLHYTKITSYLTGNAYVQSVVIRNNHQ